MVRTKKAERTSCSLELSRIGDILVFTVGIDIFDSTD